MRRAADCARYQLNMMLNDTLYERSPSSLPHRERPAIAGVTGTPPECVGRPINRDTAALIDAQRVFQGRGNGKKKVQEFWQRVAAGGGGMKPGLDRFGSPSNGPALARSWLGGMRRGLES